MVDFTIFADIKMSCYWYNRQELLQKTKDKYHNCGGKEKAAGYYIANKDLIKEKANNRYKNLLEKKEAKKYGKNRYKNMKKIGKNINFCTV